MKLFHVPHHAVKANNLERRPFRNGVLLNLPNGQEFLVRARSLSSDRVVSALLYDPATVEIVADGARVVAEYTSPEGQHFTAFVGAWPDERTIKEQWLARKDWVRHLRHFVPKSMLEPWFGDLLESEREMRCEGRSVAYIRRAVAAQVVLLILNAAKSFLLDIAERLATGIARAAK